MGGRLDKAIQEATRGGVPDVGALFERYGPQLHQFFRMQLGPRLRARETPEDMVQTVFREVLQDLDEYRPRGEESFRRWLFLTAWRKIRDRHVHHGRACRDPEREVGPLDRNQAVDAVTPSRVARGREEVRRFEAAVAGLTQEQRDVVVFARVLGMSHEEIAAETGRTATASRALLHRALARLAVRLEPPEEG